MAQNFWMAEVSSLYIHTRSLLLIFLIRKNQEENPATPVVHSFLCDSCPSYKKNYREDSLWAFGEQPSLLVMDRENPKFGFRKNLKGKMNKASSFAFICPFLQWHFQNQKILFWVHTWSATTNHIYRHSINWVFFLFTTLQPTTKDISADGVVVQ